MTRVTIDLEEEDFNGVNIENNADACFRYSIAHDKVLKAFNEEKEKIEIGDWVYSDLPDDPIIFRWTKYYATCSKDKYSRLPQNIQKALNREIER